jgi:hypothetical protein
MITDGTYCTKSKLVDITLNKNLLLILLMYPIKRKKLT